MCLVFVFFRRDENLPQHLRSFTAGAVYVRILTCGIEVLQFLKRYSEAVKQLEQLIGQNVYQLEYRGRWYDRLALNLDFHLKRPMQVLPHWFTSLLFTYNLTTLIMLIHEKYIVHCS